MKHLFVSLVSLLVVALPASSARADDCGTSDRVELPICAEVKRASVMGDKGSLTVVNKCAYRITVKFDKSGSDVRRDIEPGAETSVETDPYATKLSCCPRYSQCSTPTPPPVGTKNLALGKPASQSSTYPYGGGVAARAVDGSSNGNFQNSSVTHTNSTPQPWWQVDLGAPEVLRQVVLSNRTDAAPDRLSNFDIKVSTDGTTWTTVATIPDTAPQRGVHPINATGRYVRVQLRGTNPLSLAEVEVYGRTNLALGKPATQSSTYPYGGGVAARAVDGNSNGNFQAGSVTHTDGTPQPWWQVDLGAVQGLREVVLYNRTDAGPERLSNFDIKVSNDGATWTTVATVPGTEPPRGVHPINTTGRFVRAQLRGTNPLSLTEVEVYGP